MNEYDVNIVVTVSYRADYKAYYYMCGMAGGFASIEKIIAWVRRAEQDHVDDLKKWAYEEAQPMALAMEDKNKNKFYGNQSECEESNANELYTKLDASAKAAMLRTKSHDDLGKHSCNDSLRRRK